MASKKASKSAQAAKTSKSKPADSGTASSGGGARAPKKSAFSKETVPFQWKIVAKSNGLYVVLSKHTEQEAAEKELERLREGELYEELDLYPIDKVIIQPKGMRDLPWNPAAEEAEKKAKAAAAKKKKAAKVAAKTKKSKSQARPKAKKKALARPKSAARKKPAAKKKKCAGPKKAAKAGKAAKPKAAPKAKAKSKAKPRPTKRKKK